MGAQAARRLVPVLPCGLLLGLAIAEGLAPGWWSVAVLLCLPHWPALLIPSLTLAHRPSRVPALITLLVWLHASGCCLPLRSASGPTVRLVTFNLQGTPFGEKAVADVLQQLQPDVVALQEVNAWTLPRTQWQRAADGEFLLLSRFPIIRHELAGKPDRPYQLAVLATPLGEMVVANLHLSQLVGGFGWMGRQTDLAGAVQQRQSARREELPGLPPSAVLAGDLNGTPHDEVVRQFTARWGDAQAMAGWGFGSTFDVDTPVIRIDYILPGTLWRPVSCRSVGCRASDHLPVVADLTR